MRMFAFHRFMIVLLLLLFLLLAGSTTTTTAFFLTNPFGVTTTTTTTTTTARAQRRRFRFGPPPASSFLDADDNSDDDCYESSSSSSSLLSLLQKPQTLVTTTSRRNVIFASLSAAAAGVAAASGMTTTTTTRTTTNSGMIPSSLLLSSSSSSSSTVPTMMTVSDAIAWIDENCDRRFLHAVAASDYRFLYRGIIDNDNEQIISLRDEIPDLLMSGTYGDNENNNNGELARLFFQELETILQQDPIRPSNGHLATTSPTIAGMWGTPASIWPIMGAGGQGTSTVETTEPVHYVWFHDGGLFYPRGIMEVKLLDRTSLIVDGRDCGRDSLQDALIMKNTEIMFSASKFLAVPYSMDEELRQGLRNAFLL